MPERAAGLPIPRAIRELIARLNRIEAWVQPRAFLPIISAGFVFVFFDIFDINVSFIQTCSDLVPGCAPDTAIRRLGFPVLANLIGYVVGSLVLAPLSDKYGRRSLLLVTMLVTGLGSLYSALSLSYVNFVASRFITGIGIGADLAIVNTYVSEVAPISERAKYVAIVFTMSSIGAVLGIWLGLLLTTAPNGFPDGVPFAIGIAGGWRWMYGLGAALALIAVLVRVNLPESVRWLLQNGKVRAARELIEQMEQRAHQMCALATLDIRGVADRWPAAQAISYMDIFKDRRYRTRTLSLAMLWASALITVYMLASGLTTVLVAIGISARQAGMVVAIGVFGMVIQAIAMCFIVERVDRRRWLPIGTAITFTGALIIGASGGHFWMLVFGATVLFIGFNLWMSPTYALTVESYPTRARVSGFGLVDSVGHISGGVAIFVAAPLIPLFSPIVVLLAISFPLVIASIVAQALPRTAGVPLDEISP